LISRSILQPCLCLLLGFAYSVVAIVLLRHGHLNEDAYILFQYSQNLARGNGIVFDAVSGPAEGATDFLWMVLIALFGKLGMLPGTAAALLNGVGLALIAHVLLRIAGGINWVAGIALALVVLSGGMAASLGGFSSLAYCGLFALTALAGLERRYGAMACFGTLLCLFRPDGVVLAFGTFLAALLTADTDGRRKILHLTVPMGLVGIAYFWWRLTYFGLWLPLPLMVKSQTAAPLEGLDANLEALEWYLPLVLPLAWLAFSRQQGGRLPAGLAVVVAGPLLLFVALAFAHQSQNIGNRFQFPILVGVVFGYLLVMRQRGNAPRAVWLALVLLPLLGLVDGIGKLRRETGELLEPQYINALPQLLRERGFVVDNIAVSEAGRFPYWYDVARMTDLVGLNTVAVVQEGAASVLARLRPGLIMIHHARRFNEDGFDPALDVIVMDAADVRLVDTSAVATLTDTAPVSALAFAAANDYVAVFVKWDPDERFRFKHVFLLAPELDLEEFLAALGESRATSYGYYAAERRKALQVVHTNG